MKLQLFLGLSAAYSSDHWKVSWTKRQLPSSTNTVVPHIGYGGYGWDFSIACSQGINDLKVDLFFKDKLLETSKVDLMGKYTLIPDGGTLDDYRVSIYKKDHQSTSISSPSNSSMNA